MKRIILSLITLMSCTVVFAQSYPDVSYTYDNAGNMTERKIIVDDTPPASKSLQELLDLESVTEKSTEQEFNLKSQTKVYPVPTNSGVNVEFENILTFENSYVELYSMTGSLIDRKESLTQANYINLQKEPRGTYFLKVVVNNNKHVWTIIKN